MELNDSMTVRVNKDEFERFKKATTLPYQVMVREMISAFNEERLVITPNEKMKKHLKVFGEKS